MSAKFDEWIRELDEDVIQGDYGYEDGEFTVYPALWRPLFRRGLTPKEAFMRALDAMQGERDDQDAERRANWDRIQAEDAKYRPLATSSDGGG
jgi:hypothetical protein